jgi:hypothetical protein
VGQDEQKQRQVHGLHVVRQKRFSGAGMGRTLSKACPGCILADKLNEKGLPQVIVATRLTCLAIGF